MQKQRKIKTPLSVKVYTIVIVSVFVCTVFMGVYNYYESKSMLKENIGVGLKNAAQTAALKINATKLEQITSPEDPYFQETRQYLLDIQTYNEIDSPIYVFKKRSSKKVSLLLTSEPSFLMNAEYEINPTMEKVFMEGISAYSPIYADRNGTWISAYAPIKDQKGHIAGILEINNHIGSYIRQLRFRLLGIVVLCLIACGVSVFIIVPLLDPILKNINILNIAAGEMQKGNYDYRVRLKAFDEIGHLAITMEKMRLSIKRYIRQLQEALVNERKAHLESIKALSGAIAVRENYTQGHIERVSKIAELIAIEMKLPEEEMDIIGYGCVLHDVGKIGINVDIINKPTQLTNEEYKKIKEHPVLGVKIIEGVEFLEKARDIILHHQERYDGKGYPDGLKGEEISLSARIVCLADSYDAMASDRPYRERLDNKEIVEIVKKESGKQFDPKVVEAFLKVVDKIEAIG